MFHSIRVDMLLLQGSAIHASWKVCAVPKLGKSPQNLVEDAMHCRFNVAAGQHNAARKCGERFRCSHLLGCTILVVNVSMFCVQRPPPSIRMPAVSCILEVCARHCSQERRRENKTFLATGPTPRIAPSGKRCSPTELLYKNLSIADLRGNARCANVSP